MLKALTSILCMWRMFTLVRPGMPTRWHARPAVEALEDRVLLANTLTWIGVPNPNLNLEYSWAVPGRWQVNGMPSNAIPQDGDTLVFNKPLVNPITPSYDPAGKGFNLTNLAKIVIASDYASTVDLEQNLTVQSGSMASGKLTGAGSLTIDRGASKNDGKFVWSGGSIEGGTNTKLIVTAKGVLQIEAGFGAGKRLVLKTRTLEVQANGKVSLLQGQLDVSQKATIVNNGTFEATGSNAVLSTDQGVTANTFINNGILNVAVTGMPGDGLTLVLPFVNQGAIQLDKGMLAFFDRSYNYGTISLGKGQDIGVIKYGVNKSDGTLQDHVWGKGTVFTGKGFIKITSIFLTRTLQRLDGIVRIPPGVTVIIPKDIMILNEGGGIAGWNQQAGGGTLQVLGDANFDGTVFSFGVTVDVNGTTRLRPTHSVQISAFFPFFKTGPY